MVYTYQMLLELFDQVLHFFQFISILLNTPILELLEAGIRVSYFSPFTNQVVSYWHDIGLGTDLLNLLSLIPGISTATFGSILLGGGISILLIVGFIKFFTSFL